MIVKEQATEWQHIGKQVNTAFALGIFSSKTIRRALI